MNMLTNVFSHASTLAASLGSSDIGSLLWVFVGAVVVLGIVFFIMRQVGAPEIAYKVLYVVVGIILLVIAMNFFFGSPHF